MAMLAEKKRRTKWAPNPQGKLWSNDSNKFGQKLLEKMGWSPGQGLGVQNQGVADVLRVQFKNDSKGLGFKENDEYWTKHQSEFSDFLLKLAEQSQTDETITPINLENKPLSLELKSSQSRSRIHYHKFTRGKDLSRYSEKDLAAILGTTAPKPDKAEEGTNKNHINAGSMTEYFKRKQYGFNSNDLDQDVNKSSTSEKESSIIENEAILCDTEVISNNFDVAVEDIDEEVVNEEVEVKKKKKKKKKRVLLNKELLNEGIEIDENINCESIDGNKCNFKKKRKSKTTCPEDNFETNQCTLEDKGNGIDMHENIAENLLTDSTKVRNVDDENIACDDFEKASEKTKINENKNKKANVNSSKEKKKSKDAIDFVADDNALDIKKSRQEKRKLDCTKNVRQ